MGRLLSNAVHKKSMHNLVLDDVGDVFREFRGLKDTGNLRRNILRKR
jgi:hypothetical protein